MTSDRDTTRIVRDWLATDEHESVDRVLDDVLDRVETTSQRGGLAWRMRSFFATHAAPVQVTAFAVVAIVAILGLRSLFGEPARLGSEDEPSPTASATITRPLPKNGDVLRPGRYSIGAPYPVGISFEVDDRWAPCNGGRYESGVCRINDGSAPGIVVAFLVVDNVVADPCSDQGAVPAVGPSVDDLVAAISSLPTFEATEAVDATVDGYSAKRFTVSAPPTTGCDLRTWMTPDRTNGVARGEKNLLVIVDVDGHRIMISAAYHPLTVTDADLAVADELIASVDFDP
jgi:hypothetical protein